MNKIFFTNKDKQIVGFSVVDKEDYVWLSKWKWSTNGGYACRRRYSKTKSKLVTVYMATEIMKYNNIWQNGKEIDHINCDKLDNRKCNLRMVTRYQNQLNKPIRKDSGSGYKGVYFTSNKTNPWMAYIYVEGKRVYLGYHKTDISAAKEYDKASEKYHGEFGRLNFRRTGNRL